MMAQIDPIENLHDNQPRVWTLTHAMIHTAPGDFIKDGSITIRNGKIEAVGRYIKTPRDAFEIDLKGAHVYAGFIESWLETESSKETSKSVRKHWDTKVRPEYRSVDNLSVKNKDIKDLRSLGFTTAHIVPKQGIFRGQSGIISLMNKPKTIKSSVAQIVDFKYRLKKEKGNPEDNEETKSTYTPITIK